MDLRITLGSSREFWRRITYGTGRVAIENQARLAILPNILAALFLHRTLGPQGAKDEKALQKQDLRNTPSIADGADRQDWPRPLFLAIRPRSAVKY